MENNNWSFNSPQQTTIIDAQPAVAKTFMASVFSWMALALAISGFTAYLFGTDVSYLNYLINEGTHKLTGLGYVVMFAPLGFVLLMSFGYQRLSASALTGLFLVYSVLTGMSLSFIFLIYTASSIYLIFGVTAAMFGFMSLVGYTTSTDLTKMGSILRMGLYGLIIASVINWFMHSSSLMYFISFISVIVFTGLTAYDVQKLKEIGSNAEAGTEGTAKLSIMGALNLYLDFINLFLALLRLFGSRRS